MKVTDKSRRSTNVSINKTKPTLKQRAMDAVKVADGVTNSMKTKAARDKILDATLKYMSKKDKTNKEKMQAYDSLQGAKKNLKPKFKNKNGKK